MSRLKATTMDEKQEKIYLRLDQDHIYQAPLAYLSFMISCIVLPYSVYNFCTKTFRNKTTNEDVR